MFPPRPSQIKAFKSQHDNWTFLGNHISFVLSGRSELLLTHTHSHSKSNSWFSVLPKDTLCVYTVYTVYVYESVLEFVQSRLPHRFQMRRNPLYLKRRHLLPKMRAQPPQRLTTSVLLMKITSQCLILLGSSWGQYRHSTGISATDRGVGSSVDVSWWETVWFPTAEEPLLYNPVPTGLPPGPTLYAVVWVSQHTMPQSSGNQRTLIGSHLKPTNDGCSWKS